MVSLARSEPAKASIELLVSYRPLAHAFAILSCAIDIRVEDIIHARGVTFGQVPSCDTIDADPALAKQRLAHLYIIREKLISH